MTRQGSRTRSCTPAQARMRRDQARAFLDVAEMVLSDDRREAHVAAALAVLAAIAAADAICGLRIQQWSRGDDHAAAVALLETVALADSTLPAKLRRLLADKDLVHYSPNLVTLPTARSMIRSARLLLAEAERL